MQRHIDVARQIGIHRHVVVFAGNLHTKPRQINDRNCVWPRGRYLPEKFSNGFAQRRLVEIACAGHSEACGSERIRYQAGIIGGCRKLGRFIFIISDDQRKTHFGGVTGALTQRQRKQEYCQP